MQLDSAAAIAEPVAEPAPEKLHIRFTQYSHLHQDDIEAYVNENYANQFVRLQWINDDSLNIVYETPEAALEALDAFTDHSHPTNHGISFISPAETRAAKPYSSRPEIEFAVRQATVNDVKPKNAAARSAYYLHNPQHDPNTRKRKNQRRTDPRGDRRNRSASPTYGALNYDDPESDEYDGSRQRNSRQPKGRSGGRSDDLFTAGGPDPGTKGRLRNRSTSPRRSEDGTEGFPDAPVSSYRSRSPASRHVARSSQSIISPRNLNQGKELFPTLGSQPKPVGNQGKELFPASSKPSTNARKELFPSAPRAPTPTRSTLSPGAKELFPEKRHRRSDAFDAADESAGFNVKGMAGNRGKELFEEKIKGHSSARMRASDLF